MRWLTREWASGGIASEAEYYEAQRQYDANLIAVTPLLSEDLRVLFGHDSAFSLHDATFAKSPTFHEAKREVVFDLMAYDYGAQVLIEELNTWYQPDLHIRIVFRDADLVSPNSFDALRYLARNPKTEIVYYEIVRLADARFEIGFLVYPFKFPYVTVQCSDAAVRVVRLDRDSVEILRGSTPA